MKYPNFTEEEKLWQQGYKNIAGIDEAGRGPLAGPVIAAAVILKKNMKQGIQKLKIKDSKKLNAKKREEIYKILKKDKNIIWAIGRSSPGVIDKFNVLQATKKAMSKAIKKLSKTPDYLILDGNMKIETNILQKSIIRGDNKVFSCACASIIAKVTRDKIMENFHKKYSKYGFDKNKGYGTRFHREKLKKYGPCKIHRKTFSPIKNI